MKSYWAIVAHRAFNIGIVIKGLDGLLELVGGGALLLTSQPAILHVVALLTRRELIEDPHDVLANHLWHLAQQLSLDTRHFAGIYLLAHGLVKIGMVASLLRGLRWSYPVAVLLLMAFIGYQGHRLFHQPSLLLALLTVIDVTVTCLIVREWRHLPAKVPPVE
jgi:uncharacterized membrane protein